MKKTYYLVKAYASCRINGEYIERYHYFGKSNKLLGYVTESGIKYYTNDDIQDYGYKSYRKAVEAGWALKDMELEPGWSVVITIIAETVAA